MNSDKVPGLESLSLIGKWKFPKDRFVYEKQVLFKHTNVLGNTYFSNYVEWQGEAREQLLLEHPGSKDFMRLNSWIMLVTYSLFHRFIGHTFFGDRVRIEITSRNVKKYSFILAFRYYQVGTDQLIGEGWQKICFTDTRKGQICPVPQIVLDIVESIREKAH